jgi:hypothetical protein
MTVTDSFERIREAVTNQRRRDHAPASNTPPA